MEDRKLSTPPPEEPVVTKIKYSKKARHGHGKDVTDVHNIRQVAGCLPIDPVSRRFLLISSSKNSAAWVIPKGGWEVDETQEHAALRETWEEAGIKGHITRQLGVFVERASKKIKAHHWIFEMEIEEIKKKYPERKKRDRRWFTFEEALIATQNNLYIQEAIRLSSLSPTYRPVIEHKSARKIALLSPTLTPSTSTSTAASVDNTSAEKSASKSTTDDKSSSEDAFQVLTKLMEKAEISP